MLNTAWFKIQIAIFSNRKRSTDIAAQTQIQTPNIQKLYTRLRHLAAIFLIPFLILSSTAHANEFLVNTTTAGNQGNASVAALASGGFVVVWEDFSASGGDTSGNAIRAQSYNASGVVQGGEFLVNTTTAGNQSRPSVAALTGGGFVVAWDDNSQSGGDTNFTSIRAQRYDSAGVAQGAEFLVNTTTSGGQTSPSMAALNGGGFVIAWRDSSQTGADTSSFAIRAQRFDAAGAMQGTEFLANSTTNLDQSAPSVAGLMNGGFVIAWEDFSQTGADTSSFAIRAQRFTAMGVAQNAELLVNTTTAGDQGIPSVAALTSGGFVIAWQDSSASGGDTSSTAVRAQRYDVFGTTQGGELLINTTTASGQGFPSVAALAGGGFIVTWQDSSQTGDDTSSFAIRAQRFDAVGALQGSEFVANTTIVSSQGNPAVTMLTDGGFVIAWQDFSQSGGDTSGNAVRAQRFDASGKAQVIEFLVNTATNGSQGAPNVAALSGGGFVIVWEDFSQSGGDISNFAVRAQSYSAVGVKQGAEFLVNTTTENNQSSTQVAGLHDGGFIIVWNDGSQTGGDTSAFAIRAQRYNATGVAQGGEFLVNTTTTGFQFSPSVAALSGGGFVVAWEDGSLTGGDPSGFAVRAQSYNAAGAPQGVEFLVNTTTLASQLSPSVTALTGGGFVIAWEDSSQTGGDTSSFAIRAQSYNAAGAPQGVEFLVNTTTANFQLSPSVAALIGGGFVITWVDSSQDGGGTGASLDIRAQRFDAMGVAQGVEFLVNTTTLGSQSNASVAALTGGGFVIAWEDFSQTSGDTSSFAIRAQSYNAAGAPQGVEFLVNTTTTNFQLSPSVAVLIGGGFVVAWQDDSQTGGDTNSKAIRANIFNTSDTTLFSSVLPVARTGFFPGGPVITVFASVINAGSGAAHNCIIRTPESVPVSLSYQQTNALNVPIGPGDVPFDLAVGQARSFILAFTPTATNSGEDVFPDIACSNGNVDTISGVNAAFLTITSVAGPDILSIGATTSNNGIINVPAGSIGFMTASAINIGAGDAAGSKDATVVVTADTGSATLGVLLQWCETDIVSKCINPAVAASTPINTIIGDTAKLFAVFAFDQTSGAGIPLDAANSRVFLRFKSPGGANYSVTSAAVTVPVP
ncbi:FIG01023050: hypothetical protein [hydrothermal vent metagenome]|uniref:Uncharacterized protein n=1 Tax=hydrothermal vent metagenome TaxID=652676 RepID=A0A3B0S5I5_9ZZZZ